MSDLGTVEHVPDGWRLRFERVLSHPPEAVWAALTEPARTPAWWGELDADLRVGGHYSMTWNEGRAKLRSTITAYDPPHLLETTGDEHHGTLRWELTAVDGGTRFVFTSTVPHDISPDALAGWHWHMEALPIALDGGFVEPSMERWEELRKLYVPSSS
jgi:uncharacterized protein YndB with AHSA1/START domain